jgi:4-hydroxybenzoate polyprenyltransferase
MLARESSLDGTSIKALVCSTLVVLLTVHAQDFADVNGDRRSGRRTLPIIAPEGSRIYMLCALPLLSFVLASIWSLGPLSSLLFVSMGSWVGIRYYLVRDEIRDQANYRLYNVCILCSYLLCLLPSINHSLQIWIMGVHLLPATVRFRALAW